MNIYFDIALKGRSKLAEKRSTAKLLSPLKSRIGMKSVAGSVTSCIPCNLGECKMERGYCQQMINEDRYKNLIKSQVKDKKKGKTKNLRGWYKPA
jgi:hypothetical protein